MSHRRSNVSNNAVNNTNIANACECNAEEDALAQLKGVSIDKELACINQITTESAQREMMALMYQQLYKIIVVTEKRILMRNPTLFNDLHRIMGRDSLSKGLYGHSDESLKTKQPLHTLLQAMRGIEEKFPNRGMKRSMNLEDRLPQQPIRHFLKHSGLTLEEQYKIEQLLKGLEENRGMKRSMGPEDWQPQQPIRHFLKHSGLTLEEQYKIEQLLKGLEENRGMKRSMGPEDWQPRLGSRLWR